jgi:hypothetical protein
VIREREAKLVSSHFESSVVEFTSLSGERKGLVLLEKSR